MTATTIILACSTAYFAFSALLAWVIVADLDDDEDAAENPALEALKGTLVGPAYFLLAGVEIALERARR